MNAEFCIPHVQTPSDESSFVCFLCAIHLCHCLSWISDIVANVLKKSLITSTRPNIDKDCHNCIQQWNKTSKTGQLMHTVCPVDLRINDMKRKQIQQMQRFNRGQVYEWSKAFREIQQLYNIHVIKVIVVVLGRQLGWWLNKIGISRKSLVYRKRLVCHGQLRFICQTLAGSRASL